MAGIAGLDFMEDMIKLVKTNWKTGSGGKLPIVTKKWETKVVNIGQRNVERIVCSLDGENPNIFSLRYDTGTGNKYDWLHDVAINFEIFTTTSEVRALQMVDELMDIIKNNVLFAENQRTYVQLLPVGINPALEEYRNIYRYIIDVQAMILNP